jgi:hypothetical protein
MEYIFSPLYTYLHRLEYVFYYFASFPVFLFLLPPPFSSSLSISPLLTPTPTPYPVSPTYRDLLVRCFLHYFCEDSCLPNHGTSPPTRVSEWQ